MPKTKRENQIPKYNPQEIEQKWQKFWEENKIYQPDLDSSRKSFYNLMMFPYPSAEGMHVGNMYAFTGSDVYGRFMRMRGFDVFEPIGLDGFGIHSENYALKVGRHPKEQAKKSEENFYRQLRATGNAFAWENKVETYDPDYYKWTQWIFIQLFKKGLAYRKKASVNFCPSCKTVLADEQVITGKCERCGSEVIKKDLEQWFFRITDYAQKLLNNIDKLDWSEKVKIAQRLWIGRSEGATVRFKIKDLRFKNQDLEVFTTRPDTLYGATFMVLSPEHSLSKEIARENSKVAEYIKKTQSKTEQERIAEGQDKTGVDTGLTAINPVNNEEIPIWIADYVLMDYGTGAIMAVPAHDLRDFEFAVKYDLPVIQVISKINAPTRSYLMGGEHISDEDLKKLGIKILDTTKEGYRKIEIPQDKIKEYEKLIEDKITPGFWNEYIAKEIVFIFKFKNGKIKRFVLSRENEEEIDRLGEEFNGRVWKKKASVWKWLAKNDTYTDLIVHNGPGAIVNSGKDWNDYFVPDAIPKIIDDLEKKGIGKRKIQYHLRDWLISRQRYWGPPIPMIYCKKCDWQPVSEKDLPVLLPDVRDWKPKGTGKSPLASVESFVKTKCPNCGGAAKRETDVSDTFLDSAWYFFRYTSTEFNDRPFDKKRATKWLPVNMYIGGAEHSVLHLLYSRFLTMFFKDLDLISFEEPYSKFRAHGLLIKEGAKMSKSRGNVVVPDQYTKKFGADTLRLYLMFLGPFIQGGDFYDMGIEGMYKFLKRVFRLVSENSIPIKSGQNSKFNKEKERMMNKIIKKVTEDIENLRYNTAIAALMEYYNFLSKQSASSQEEIKSFLLLLAPFAPHMTEELWQNFSKNKSIHKEPWPKFDTAAIVEEEAMIVIQINGKIRDTLRVSREESENQQLIEKIAKESQKIKKYLSSGTIKKVIYVKEKVINFVVV